MMPGHLRGNNVLAGAALAAARRRNGIAGRKAKSDARLRMHYAINYYLSLCSIQSRQVTIGERINPRRLPRNVRRAAHVHAIIISFEEETRNGSRREKNPDDFQRRSLSDTFQREYHRLSRARRLRQSNGRPLHNSASR